MFKNQEYNTYLTNFFSISTIKNISENGLSKRLTLILNKAQFEQIISSEYKFSDFYEELYNYLKENYRSEYVYKNVIADKILFQNHQLKESTLLTELRACGAKIDVAIFNGTSTAYEIKSEFDTTDRLNNQLNNYLKMFDKVYVVTDKKKEHEIIKKISPKIGVIVLNEKCSLVTIKKAKSNKANIIPEETFKVFNKHEHLEILKMNRINTNRIPNTKIFSKAEKIFCKLKPHDAHKLMVSLLIRRKNYRREKFIQEVPKSLRVIAVSGLFNSKQKRKIREKLSTKFSLQA
jgi:hypothetical protein